MEALPDPSCLLQAKYIIDSPVCFGILKPGSAVTNDLSSFNCLIKRLSPMTAYYNARIDSFLTNAPALLDETSLRVFLTSFGCLHSCGPVSGSCVPSPTPPT